MTATKSSRATRTVVLAVLFLCAITFLALAVRSVSGAVWRVSEREPVEIGDSRQIGNLSRGQSGLGLSINPESIREAIAVIDGPRIIQAVVEEMGLIAEATPVETVPGAPWVYVGNSFVANRAYGIFMDSRDGARHRREIGEWLEDVQVAALTVDEATVVRESVFRVLPLVQLETIDLSRGGAGSEAERALMMARYWEKYGNRSRDAYLQREPYEGERLPPGTPPTAEQKAQGLEDYLKNYGEEYARQTGNWSPEDGFLNPGEVDHSLLPSRSEVLQRYLDTKLPDGIPEAPELRPGEYVKDSEGTRFIKVNVRRNKTPSSAP